jgi:hypothetical protein
MIMSIEEALALVWDAIYAGEEYAEADSVYDPVLRARLNIAKERTREAMARIHEELEVPHEAV